jgi:hypothetical protein
MKANPTIVTPKDPKVGDLGLLILLDEQVEVSNLTQPAVLAGSAPGASQEEDTETVTSATSMMSVGSKQLKKDKLSLALVAVRASTRLLKQNK